MLEFSIIIPTYNRAAILRKSLEALSLQKNSPGFEVIVIDDGSTDNTQEVIKDMSSQAEYQIHSILTHNTGAAQARNNALQIVKGRYTAFIGDDIIVGENWLKTHFKAHQTFSRESTAILGFTDWPDMPWVDDYMKFLAPYGEQFNYSGLQPWQKLYFGYFYTSNISLPTWMLKEELFDPTFPGAACEDQELGYRLEKKFGLSIRYCPDAVAVHWHPLVREKYLARMRLVGRSMRKVISKHPELSNSKYFPGPKVILFSICFLMLWLGIARLISLRFYWKIELYYHKYAGYLLEAE